MLSNFGVQNVKAVCLQNKPVIKSQYVFNNFIFIISGRVKCLICEISLKVFESSVCKNVAYVNPDKNLGRRKRKQKGQSCCFETWHVAHSST